MGAQLAPVRVLVTGGAGFIGVNASLRLAERGYRVTALDNLSRRGSERNAESLRHAGIELLRADVTDAHAVDEAVASHGVDGIIHMAAQVAVTTSLADPQGDFATNAQGTLNVLEAARRHAPGTTLIYASTNKVYGALEGIPLARADVGDQGSRRWWPADGRPGVTELEPLDFHSPYGCSKGAADQYVHDYARCYGLRTVVLRQSCIYGRHQYGNEDQGWVAHFVHATLGDRPINVYGDGHQVRDLLHVDDLTDLYETLLREPDRARGRIFNAGGGVENARSVLQVLTAIHQKLDREPAWAFGPEREGDQRWFVSDNRSLEQAVGWRPTTGFEAGLDELLGWARTIRREAAAAAPQTEPAGPALTPPP